MSLATSSDKTHSAIMNLAAQREERRRQAEELKKRKANEARELQERGKFGDSDFVSMIERFRSSSALVKNPRAYAAGEAKINVAVRKRPCSDREIAALDHDSVTCANPFVIVHHCKLKVDGITKLLENTQFEFDYAFSEDATNDQVYDATCLPLVQFAALQDGRSTVFAYGQTGSGKTFTMQGLQTRVARDIFRFARARASKDSIVRVKCANFELYGAQCLDLLNERRVCAVREDGQGEIHIDGLHEEEAADEDDFLTILQRGMAVRTTRSTEMNSDSSRSHAIFQVSLSTGGKLSLIDLAGSERGQDSKNHDQTRRVESAYINKSLLALKECIRALDPGSGATHVPYRGSKLTMVLKDSFAEHSKTVMISCVSPAASSSDHTLNTLRYADRVKAKGGQHREQTSTAVMTNTKSPGPSRKSIAPPRQSIANPPGAQLSRSTSPPQVGNTQQGPKPLQPHSTATTTTAPPKPQADQNKRGRFPMSPRTSALTSNMSTVSLNTSGVGLDNSRLSVSSKLQLGNMHDHDISDDSLDLPGDDDDDNARFDYVKRDEEENHLPMRKKDHVSGVGVTPTGWKKLEVPGAVQQQHTPQQPPPAPVVPVSVYALVDEEEALLASYSQAVQHNFRIISEESSLLKEIDSHVDYDVEVYMDKLRVLLEQKLKIFGELHTKLLVFQDHLKVEEQYAVGSMKRG